MLEEQKLPQVPSPRVPCLRSVVRLGIVAKAAPCSCSASSESGGGTNEEHMRLQRALKDKAAPVSREAAKRRRGASTSVSRFPFQFFFARKKTVEIGDEEEVQRVSVQMLS